MKKKKEKKIIDLHKYCNTYFGFSKYTQKLVIASWGLSIKSNNIYTKNEILDLEKFLIDNFYKEDFLKNEFINNIKYYKNLKNYRGFRHLNKLPVNGQNTRNNRQTVRNMKIPSLDIMDTVLKINILLKGKYI